VGRRELLPILQRMLRDDESEVRSTALAKVKGQYISVYNALLGYLINKGT